MKAAFLKGTGAMALMALWLTFAGNATGAEAVTMKTVVEENVFFVGDRFSFYLVIEGATPDEVPVFAESEDWSIRAIGSQVSDTPEGQIKTYTFEAVPLRAGDLELPVARVLAGGVMVTSTAVAFEVRAPATTDRLRLKISLSETECYLGEAVVLTVTWESDLVLNGLRAVDLRLPLFGDSRFANFEPLDAIDPASSEAIGVPVSNSRVIARVSDEDGANEAARPATISFRRVIVPRTAGDLIIEPVTLLCTYLPPKDKKFSGFRYPSYFNNDFFERDITGERERYLVASNEVALTVKPLPREGKPPRFDGIVGAITLATDVAPKVASQDDPLTLTLRLGEHPFPQTLRLPELAHQDALGHSFVIGSEEPERKILRNAGVAEFAQMIRPERSNIPSVPVIRFTYFDPVKGEYGEAASEPVPVRISRADKITAFDAEFADGSRLQNVVRAQEGGVHQNYLGEGVLRPRARAGLLRGKTGLWLLILLGPPILIGVAALATREWRFALRDPEGARAARAFAKFERRLRELGPDRPAEMKAAMDAYFADRLGRESQAVEGREIARLLGDEGIDGDVRKSLKGFWERLDANRFARSQVNGAGLDRAVAAMPEVIAKVERGLREKS